MKQGNKAEDLARKGARLLLTKCLSLSRGDTLAVFWDGSAREVAQMLLQAASELEICVRERYVPLQEQFKFSGRLTNEDQSALAEARGIVTCLAADPRAIGYRRELLKVGPSFDNFFGHMPGPTMHVLTLAATVNYRKAAARCDELTLALSLANSAKLRTFVLDRQGHPREEYQLHLKFAGFERPPISSPGTIPKGTWGNLPGGEAFIAPLEGYAHGTFVLNGAFRKHVVRTGSALFLDFADGRLTRVTGGGLARAAFDRLMTAARRSAGPAYDVVAELGIGINSGLKRLTGTALFDEKCAGTAHIALGDNERYGGKNSAKAHEDLITRLPSLELDGVPILSHGRNVLDPRRFRESIGDPPSEGFDASPCRPFELSNEVSIERTIDGGLQIRRFVAAGRVCQYTVGDAETSRILYSLFQYVPASLQEILPRARKDLGLGPARVRRGLEILTRHHVIYTPEVRT